MSDDVKATEVAEQKAEAPVQNEMQAELKKVIAERDKAKAKLREREEEDRKALEAKALEEGKLKELLTSKENELSELKKFKDSVEAERQAQRAKVLDSITDSGVKKFAEKMSDANEITEFLKIVEEKKLTTHTANSAKTAPEAPKFKNFRDWESAQSGGNTLIPKL